jgi:hypothetical protein
MADFRELVEGYFGPLIESKDWDAVKHAIDDPGGTTDEILAPSGEVALRADVFAMLVTSKSDFPGWLQEEDIVAYAELYGSSANGFEAGVKSPDAGVKSGVKSGVNFKSHSSIERVPSPHQQKRTLRFDTSQSGGRKKHSSHSRSTDDEQLRFLAERLNEARPDWEIRALFRDHFDTSKETYYRKKAKLRKLQGRDDG